MVKFELNGSPVESQSDGDTPLLWVIRDELGLKGTKFGCGIALCGACTVHVDGVAQRSCSYPLSAAAGKQVTTIEGLNNEHALGNPEFTGFFLRQRVIVGNIVIDYLTSE